MKVTRPIATPIATVIAAAALALLGIAGAPIASGQPLTTSTDTFGQFQRIADPNGIDITYWKISDLKPSTDTIPDYPAAGALWEVTATAKAVRGNPVLVVPNFNARADDGTNYRVIWQYNTPNSLSASRLAQDDEVTGKLYFDVAGPPPTTVAYSDAIRDILIWGPPSTVPVPT